MPKLTDLYSVNRLSTLQELQQHWKTQAHPYETCLFFFFFLTIPLFLPSRSTSLLLCPFSHLCALLLGSCCYSAHHMVQRPLLPSCFLQVYAHKSFAWQRFSGLQSPVLAPCPVCNKVVFYFASLTIHSFHFLALISKQRLAQAILC